PAGDNPVSNHIPFLDNLTRQRPSVTKANPSSLTPGCPGQNLIRPTTPCATARRMEGRVPHTTPAQERPAAVAGKGEDPSVMPHFGALIAHQASLLGRWKSCPALEGWP